MNFDHLVNVPAKITGVVVSTKTLPNGYSIFIKPDDGAFVDRRFVGHSVELQSPAAEVKAGMRVSFLPAAATRKGRMPRAYSIEVVRKMDNGL